VENEYTIIGIKRRYSVAQSKNIGHTTLIAIPSPHIHTLTNILQACSATKMNSRTLLKAILTATAFLVSSSPVHAQTPPNTQPATNATISASYGEIRIAHGNIVPQTSVLSPPDITFPATPSILILIDLDAPLPSNRTFAPLLHYMVASSPSTNNITAIAVYIPPHPPAGSSAHRYEMLTYERTGSVNEAFVIPEGFGPYTLNAESRLKFDLEGFVQAAGLKGPIGGNYFLVKPEAGNATVTTSAVGTATGTSGPAQYTGAAGKKEVLGFGGLLTVLLAMLVEV
jgi:hypothetical protein